MWSWGAHTIRLASILILAIERSSSWVSLGGAPVNRGYHCLQMGHWCSLTTHRLQNQCRVSVPPQPRSCPRSLGSENTLHSSPGQSGWGASPMGILRGV